MNKIQQDINTPCGIGKFKSFDGELVTVEFNWSHLVQFGYNEVDFLEDPIIGESEYPDMKDLRKKKLHTKTVKWALISFAIGFTPFAMLMARLERGYFTIGGEVFLGLFPLALWALWRNLKDDLKELFNTIKTGEQK